MATYQVQDPAGQLHEIEGPDDASPDQITAQAQSLIPKPPANNAVESAIHGFVNNIPLGPQVAAGADTLAGKLGLGTEGPMGNKPTYSENLEKYNKTFAEAKKEHPVAYGAGAVGGTIAPLAIPGVGEAMAASPIAGNAAYGAANAISNTDLMKNPGEATKQAVGGAAIGGAVGAAAKGIGSLFSKAGDALAPAANRLEANATANALDVNPRALFKMAKGGNPETVALDINKNLNKLLPDTIGLNDTAASKFQKLSNAHEAAGTMIGNVIDSTSKNLGKELPEVDAAIKELGTASKKYAGLEFEDSVQSKAILDDAAKMLSNLKDSGNLNFRNLASLKQEIGQIYHNPNNVVRGVDQAYSILSDSIDNILDRVSVENPMIKPQYNQAKEIFKFTSDVLPAMGRGVAREVAGKSGGLTNAALGVGALFHPGLAGAAYAGKTMAHMAAPELGTNLAYKAVNAVRNGAGFPAGIGQGASQALIDFLESKYGVNKTK